MPLKPPPPINRWIAFALAFVLGLCLSAQPAAAADSHLIYLNTPVEITEHGVCKDLESTVGTVFVPTKTAAEWSSFYDNIAGVTVLPCCLATSYGGYCYRYGAVGQSCTTVCASYGGYDAAGTNASNVSNASCKNLMDALDIGEDGTVVTEELFSTNLGCYVDTGQADTYRVRSANTPTAGASTGAVRRVCSCRY